MSYRVQQKTEPLVEKTAVSVLSNDFLDNLTGNRLTARALGGKVWCSAQTINKRIVEAGLAIKLPCGENMITEMGRPFGEATLKTTAKGHIFSNIEWDEKIFEIIFTHEDLQNVAERQSQVGQILAI